jgi:DNA-directed RNA polymerase subunit K/omega
MSDDEYYSDDNSDNSDSDIEQVSNKKPLINIAIKKMNFASSNDYDDSEPDDADDDDDEDNDDENNVEINDEDDNDDDDIEQIGGVGDDDDDDDDVLQYRTQEQSDDENIELDEEGEPVVKEVKKSSKAKKTMQLIVDDDDDDYDDEYDENYLQKFDNDIIKNYVNEYHPECLNHNYDEIAKLSVVTRNSDGIIIDPFHKTIPFLTKYERARVLGQRAKQIETGAKPLVKVPENVIDGYIIAELELKEKKIPFIIRRPIPGGACEYWNLKDLEVIAY